MTELYVGTSGFSYPAWKGSFYPAELPAAGMLEFYSGQLPAVEINNTFYRMPRRELLVKWRETVPADFRFVLKAPQRISHQKRLVDCEQDVAYLIEVSEALGERRGPFLIQLPPYLRKDVERLRGFLEQWPAGQPAAFEFRHASWHDDEIVGLLTERGIALCVADQGDADARAPLVRTADWGYLRLRREEYHDDTLRAWVERLRAMAWQKAFVFFKHEDEGTGPRLARRFRELFAEVG
jgi:uncharacterized protein YecE (DUF72 family)